MSERIELQHKSRAERHGFAVGDRVYVQDQQSKWWAGYGRIIHVGGCADGAHQVWCRDSCRVFQVDIIGGVGGNLGGAQMFAAPELAHAD